MPRRPLQIDVIVPFCNRKCGGCGRQVITEASSKMYSDYVDALVREISSVACEMDGYEVVDIHLTGGTPQLLLDDDVCRIFSSIYESFSMASEVEVLVDVMPGRISAKSLSTYRSIGVDRILVNMITTQGREMKGLGRGCDVTDVRATIELFEKENFLEYGLAISYGLPSQTQESLDLSLADAYFFAPKFVMTRPSRLSSSVEQMAIFYERSRRFWAMYAYDPVTTTQFALHGHEVMGETRRNDGCAYVGFGLAAESCFEGLLCRNTHDLAVYLEASDDPNRVYELAGKLSTEDCAYRAALMRLKNARGLATGEIDPLVKKMVEHAVADGFLCQDDDRYLMTPTAIAMGEAFESVFTLSESR